MGGYRGRGGYPPHVPPPLRSRFLYRVFHKKFPRIRPVAFHWPVLGRAGHRRVKEISWPSPVVTVSCTGHRTGDPPESQGHPMVVVASRAGQPDGQEGKEDRRRRRRSRRDGGTA